jgi:hypothetical protein
MRTERAGALLLALGLMVGTAAGVGLIVGFEPARLPRELLNIAAYKLTFLAAGGLLVAGAVMRRYGRRGKAARGASLSDRERAMLGEPLPADAGIKVKTPDRTPNADQSFNQ